MVHLTKSNLLLRCEKSFCKKNRKLFRSFREVVRSFGKFFEAFGRVRTHSDPFGPIGMHSDASGSIWERLDAFENFQLFFDVFAIVF